MEGASPCCSPCVPEDSQGDGRWMSMHNQYLSQTKEREPDILMIGDSIFYHLQNSPVWREIYEPLHCLNFGIPGDCIQHVLWRIKNGELENINPKIVVVLVGTNNHENTPEEISDGLVEIVTTVREHLPSCYIVMVELLPRGQFPNHLREKNKQVNRLIRKKLMGFPFVEIVNSDKALIQSDGTISFHDMPDFLHPSDTGYRKVFEPLYELLIQLLYDNEKEQDLTPSD